MRIPNLTLLILFVVSMSAGCADGDLSSGNLAQKLLAQKTFTISSDSYANAACSLSAGSSVSSLTTSTITVTFTENQFTVTSSLEKISGTWKMIDDNTLQLTIDDQTATVDVIINGNVLIISEPSGSADCGASNSVASSPAPSSGPIELPSSDTSAPAPSIEPSSEDTSPYELPVDPENTSTMSAPDPIVMASPGI